MKTFLALVLVCTSFFVQAQDDKKTAETPVATEEIFPVSVKTLAKKGAAVYVESNDKNAVQHAKDALEYWGYWKVTTNKSTADFTLKLLIRSEVLGFHVVYGQFIDKSGKEIYSTREVMSGKNKSSFDFNMKRGAVKQFVELKLKPNFK